MSLETKGLDAAKKLVTAKYIESGAEALRADERIIRSVIAQRKAPETGLPDPLIEQLLNTLALMDSNNFHGHVGAGEREGRVFSNLVAKRHYHMSHGMGRSGELTADQPKAAGSSLMAQLTNHMVTDFLKIAGAEKVEMGIVVPMATGMSLSLVLSSFRKSRPNAKYVVWPRIDQKTCLKCIGCAGYEVEVVQLQPAAAPKPPKLKRDKKNPAAGDSEGEKKHVDPSGTTTPPVEAEGTEATAATMTNVFVQINPTDIDAAIERLGAENVLAVLSTTSCFSPRLPDDVLAISRICKTRDVPYVVNNAYGVQSAPVMKMINNAIVHGRLDAFVQSGDKNFLVPVGGSVVAGKKSVVKCVSELYAGRASSSPIMDLFVTCLSMGRLGFKKLLNERYEILEKFHTEIRALAEELGEEVMIDPRNDISFAMTLKTIAPAAGSGEEEHSESVAEAKFSELGAQLFRHCVSGPRVVGPTSAPKTLAGRSFLNYGSHYDGTKVPMLVMACGIGMENYELEVFMERLRHHLKELRGSTTGGEQKKK